jgi:glutamyl-tRNA synthetase
MTSTPRLRFAPSPTGYLHIGGARTALFNYLYAKRHGGTFVLRMEDTDRERSTPESVEAIYAGMRWLGLQWDEGPGVDGGFGPYFQTERLHLYREHAERLISEGKAYRCYCTREEIETRRRIAESEKRQYRYEGTCRDRTDAPDLPAIIRFRMPEGDGSVTFDDRVLGPITKLYSDLDDWVMLRADGIPLYNFGCVIDDHTMGITVVGRGQEHVNSTFPQLMLYRALGWEPPDFAHFPLILGTDREKLSKRRHPEADVMAHQKNGILPEALLNFVVRLGWSHGNDEVIPLDQMIEWFDFAQVGTANAVWNPEKLLWLNAQYLKLLPRSVVAERLEPFLAQTGYPGLPQARRERLVEVLAERSQTLVELAEKATVFLQQGVTFDPKAVTKHLHPDGRALLSQVRALLAGLQWEPTALEGAVKTVSEQASVGMGKVAQPLRVAITGSTSSPGIGETLELIGREESLARIDAALALPQA